MTGLHKASGQRLLSSNTPIQDNPSGTDHATPILLFQKDLGLILEQGSAQEAGMQQGLLSHLQLAGGDTANLRSPEPGDLMQELEGREGAGC